MLLTSCEDAHLLSRLDSKLSNLRFPWEAKNDGQVVVPVGGLNCWKVDSTSQWYELFVISLTILSILLLVSLTSFPLRLNRKLISTLYYDQSATSVAVFPSEKLVAVGLEHGLVVIYKASNDWVDYAESTRVQSTIIIIFID